MLLDGSLSMEASIDKAIFSSLKNISLKLVALWSKFLHMLQAGVIAEVKSQEKCALSLVSEYQVNNKHIFVEKSVALEA